MNYFLLKDLTQRDLSSLYSLIFYLQLKALRAVKALSLDNLVVGQYVANKDSSNPKAQMSYKDVKDVPEGVLSLFDL